LGLLLLAISAAPEISGDATGRYADAVWLSLLQYPIATKFSSVQGLLSAPLFLLGNWLRLNISLVPFFNLAIFALLISSLAVLLEPKRRFIVLLLLMATTMFPHHLQHFYGEVLTASFCTLGVFCIFKTRWVLATVCIGLGAAQTPASIPAVAVTLLFLSTKHRNYRYLGFLILPVSIMFFENWLKFNSLLPTHYTLVGEAGAKSIMPYSGLPGFSYPLVFGIVSNLFSFGKGILFFVPSLILRREIEAQNLIDQRSLELIDALLIFVLVLLLTYARWWAWYGGAFWGPRYFLIASIPGVLIIAHHIYQTDVNWRKRVVFSMITILSGWVCVQGYLFGNRDLEVCFANNYALEALCWYAPEFSPLFRQFVMGFTGALPHRIYYAAWCTLSVLYILFTVITKKAHREAGTAEVSILNRQQQS